MTSITYIVSALSGIAVIGGLAYTLYIGPYLEAKRSCRDEVTYVPAKWVTGADHAIPEYYQYDGKQYPTSRAAFEQCIDDADKTIRKNVF